MSPADGQRRRLNENSGIARWILDRQTADVGDRRERNQFPGNEKGQLANKDELTQALARTL